MTKNLKQTRAALAAMISFRNYRWAGRLTGFLSMAIIISFMLGQGFEMLKEARASYDLLFLLTLFTFSALAYIIGWIIEIVGGALLLLAGLAIAFYLSFSAVFPGNGYALLLALPLIITGIFYLLSWRNKLVRMKNVNQY